MKRRCRGWQWGVAALALLIAGSAWVQIHRAAPGKVVLSGSAGEGRLFWHFSRGHRKVLKVDNCPATLRLEWNWR